MKIWEVCDIYETFPVIDHFYNKQYEGERNFVFNILFTSLCLLFHFSCPVDFTPCF